MSPAGEAWAALAIVLLSLGTSLAVWRFTDWRAYTAAALGLALGFLAVNFLLFHAARVALVLVAPLGALAFTYATGNLTRYVTEGREKKRYRTTLMRYVAPQIVQAMTEDRRLAELHNEKRELTVLFSDVRGFTTMSEKLPVDELVATLNEFLNGMVEVIFRNQGTLDKFVGDCVMAFWGAPLHQENHAELCAPNGPGDASHAGPAQRAMETAGPPGIEDRRRHQQRRDDLRQHRLGAAHGLHRHRR